VHRAAIRSCDGPLSDPETLLMLVHVPTLRIGGIGLIPFMARVDAPTSNDYQRPVLVSAKSSMTEQYLVWHAQIMLSGRSKYRKKSARRQASGRMPPRETGLAALVAAFRLCENRRADDAP